MGSKYDYLVGVDEVGRGSLAGPVTVSAVAFRLGSMRGGNNFIKRPGDHKLKDSKKTTRTRREKWLENLRELAEKNKFKISTSFSKSEMIDRNGIIPAIRKALEQSLKKLKLDPKKTLVLLDGGLSAPKEFRHQKTIIKGDEKEPIIALASIAAKVERDRYMKKISKQYPIYGFENHKGYGTKSHCQILRQFGPSPEHRRSYIGKGENSWKMLKKLAK
jgi:ribonuclease HII